jgi:hypothetical protein
MAEVSGGELQTLISTLQNGNTQLGHIYKQLGTVVTSLSSLTSQMNVLASAAIGTRLGDSTAADGPLPPEPDGYITIDIPGVGPRYVPYYSGG